MSIEDLFDLRIKDANTIKQQATRIAELEQQRDELLAALRQMEGAVDRYEDNEVREYVKDRCRAAIAKVKP